MNGREWRTRIADIEQRLEHLEHRVKALEGLAVDLTLLKTMVGDLKFEIEQMQEV
jgi:hypothetical protein